MAIKARCGWCRYRSTTVANPPGTEMTRLLLIIPSPEIFWSFAWALRKGAARHQSAAGPHNARRDEGPAPRRGPRRMFHFARTLPLVVVDWIAGLAMSNYVRRELAG
jgi:hypothetical protein